MKTSKADLILHPARMRIVMAVVNRPMTAGQIAAVLADVPQATLYRHIKLLSDAGVLQVVEERPIRGTVEKVYALNNAVAYIGAADAAQMSREEHLRTFVMFVTTLIGDYERYLQQAEIEIAQEVSYSKAPIYLSDEELIELNTAMQNALLPLINNPPGAGRKRRILASIFMPDADAPTESS